MSREIKFRAWDDTKKEWTLNMWTLNIMECVSSKDRNIWLEPVLKTHKVFIEQYTGLKDKNGKEIYEGDILREEGLLSPTYVVWDDVYARYLTKIIKTDNTVSSYFYFDHNTASHSKVIGNIHENQELLVGEK